MQISLSYHCCLVMRQGLLYRLHPLFCAVGSVLVFVTRKTNCEQLATQLKARDLSRTCCNAGYRTVMLPDLTVINGLGSVM